MKLSRARNSFEMEFISKTPLPVRTAFIAQVHLPDITMPETKQRPLSEYEQKHHGKFNSNYHFINHRALPLEYMSSHSKKSFSRSSDKLHSKIADEETKCDKTDKEDEIFLSNGNKYIYKPSYREAAIASYRKHNLLQRGIFSESEKFLPQPATDTISEDKSFARDKRAVSNGKTLLNTQITNQTDFETTNSVRNMFPKFRDTNYLSEDENYIVGNEDKTCENYGKTLLSLEDEKADVSSSILSSVYLQSFRVPQPPPNSQNSDTITVVSETDNVPIVTIKEPNPKTFGPSKKLVRKLKKLRTLKDLTSKVTSNLQQQSARKNDSENKRENRNNSVVCPRQRILVEKSVTIQLPQTPPHRKVFDSKARTLFFSERKTPELAGMKIYNSPSPSAKCRALSNTLDIRPSDRLVTCPSTERWLRPIFELPDGNLDDASTKSFLISQMKITPGNTLQKDDPLLFGHLDVYGRERMKWSNPPTLFKIGILAPEPQEQKRPQRKSFGVLTPSNPKDQNIEFTKIHIVV